MALSFDEIWSLLSNEIGEKKWVVQVYDTYFIYEDEPMNKLFRADYSIGENNQVTIGSPVEVEKKTEYIPVQVQAAGKLLAASDSKESDDYGYKWRVQVVEYGMGKDGRINWPKDPLVAAIDLYDNAKVFALDESQHLASQKPFGKSVKELVGWLKNPVDTGTGIEADLFILKSAKWLRDALVDSHERGNPDLLGLSHDVSAKAVVKRGSDGKSYKEPVEIVAVQVDVVYDPTNNGKFIRMAAAVGQGGDNDMFEKLMAGLAKARPDLHKKITDGIADKSLTEDQAIEMIAAATIVDAGGDDKNEKLVAALVDQMKKIIVVDDKKGSPELDEMKLLAAGMTLDRELENSKLPERMQASIRKRFEKKVFDVEDLKAAIVDAKELVDDLVGSGNVTGAGGNGRVEVLRGSVEKLQAAFDGMMGVRVDEQFSDVRPMTGLRAAYVEMTGDSEVRGYLNPEQTRRLQAAYGSTTFSYVLGNTLYRRLVQDYREMPDMGVSLLVGNNIRKATDFRPMESINVGYYGDLPDVDPEAEDYQDLGEVGDEEISYSINQKGGLITITRKMIINDDMRTVNKVISRAPRAARRTLAKRCWAPFINNATYKGDSKAIFHADHGNLGSAAYGITSALAAKTAMAAQTEPDSGEKLMLRPVAVSFPSTLFGIVKNVNDFNPQAVTVDNGNSMYGFFAKEKLFENPFMTDVSDWIYLADPMDVEILELAFLNGQREPEMFVADQNTVGQMFIADKIQYKIRHEYECEPTDYRGVYKAVVAD